MSSLWWWLSLLGLWLVEAPKQVLVLVLLSWLYVRLLRSSRRWL
jgi:hypothetical protein